MRQARPGGNADPRAETCAGVAVRERQTPLDSISHARTIERVPRTRRKIMGDKTPKRPPKVKKPKPAAKPPTKSA